MDVWNGVPSWLTDASSAVLILLSIAFFYMLLRYSIAPIINGLVASQKEMNDERKRMAEEDHKRGEEQRRFYEETVIPALKDVSDNLKKALVDQRELYEHKLTALAREHTVERERLVAQIAILEKQVMELTERIQKMEDDGKKKDNEIKRLRDELAKTVAERDTLRAKLDAMEAAAKAAEASEPKDNEKAA